MQIRGAGSIHQLGELLARAAALRPPSGHHWRCRSFAYIFVCVLNGGCCLTNIATAIIVDASVGEIGLGGCMHVCGVCVRAYLSRKAGQRKQIMACLHIRRLTCVPAHKHTWSSSSAAAAAGGGRLGVSAVTL